MDEDANTRPNVEEFVLTACASSNSIASPGRFDKYPKLHSLEKSVPNLDSSSTSSDPQVPDVVLGELDYVRSRTTDPTEQLKISSFGSGSSSILSVNSTLSSSSYRSRKIFKKTSRARKRSRSRSRKRSKSHERNERNARSRSKERSWDVATYGSDNESDYGVIPSAIKYAGEGTYNGSMESVTVPSWGTKSSSNRQTLQMSDIENGLKKSKHFIPIQFAPAGPDDDFRVIVLLLDPRTRKFELIHCYFDNENALVKDVLNLIPKNATSRQLQKQVYLGLCRPGTGEEMINSFMTKEYNMQNNEILIAVPRGLTGDQCIYHAEAILTNKKLIKLIRRADPRWKAQKQKINAQRNGEKHNPFTEFIENMIEALQIMLPVKRRKRKIRYMLRFLFVCALTRTFVTFALTKHANIMKPIYPEEKLTLTQWKNQCGLLSIFPRKVSGCRSISLVVNNFQDNDDIEGLTLYDEDAKLLWEMSVPKYKKEKEDQSNDVSIDSKGRVIINGSIAKVTAITEEGMNYISPWPFHVVPPNMKKGWLARFRSSK